MSKTLVVHTNKEGQGIQCSPNLLPCQIHHDGPVNASERYWSPQKEEDGSYTAYFRGRKLRGTTLNLPQGYEGIVVRQTSKIENVEMIETDGADIAAAEDPEPEIVEARVVEEMANFEEITLWSHGAVPECSDDPHARGLSEWIKFAQTIHDYDNLADEP